LDGAFLIISKVPTVLSFLGASAISCFFLLAEFTGYSLRLMGLSSGAMSYVYCFYVCIKTTEAVVGKLTPFGKMPMQKNVVSCSEMFYNSWWFFHRDVYWRLNPMISQYIQYYIPIKIL
jgi:hypothetical protein